MAETDRECSPSTIERISVTVEILLVRNKIVFKIQCVCVSVCLSLWSYFSSSAFICVPGVELRLLGLCGKHFAC